MVEGIPEWVLLGWYRIAELREYDDFGNDDFV